MRDWATALQALYECGQECTRQELSARHCERAYRQLEGRASALARAAIAVSSSSSCACPRLTRPTTRPSVGCILS